MQRQSGELISRERRFQLLVEAVVDYAIYMLDPDGYIISWNSGAQRIKGYTADEILGQHFSRFFTPEDQSLGKPAKALAIARETGRFEDEGWRVRKDGRRFWALAVVDAIRDDNGELLGFAKVTRDITERREAQLALDAAREQLVQAQKLEAVGQLTGGIAHDFNNLLTVILGSLSMIERLADGDERLSRRLSAIRQAAERGEKLTKQLLAFSRRQPLRPEVIRPSEQLEEMAELLGRSLRGDIDIECELPNDLWPVEVDPNQLELAVLNIGLNARDAMPSGGTLRIGARNVTARGEEVGLDGDYVAITLTDTGVGIPKHLRGRVFEPFFTTKEVGKGSGLGLSQAYGFAKQSGGTIKIDSEVGRGTTVTLYLPASKSAPAAARPEPAAGPTAAEMSGTVLLVEDDPAVAELAVALLERSGYTVRLAESPRPALEILRGAAQIDLVFSDIVMPGGMSGVDLARTVRAEFPNIPVLLATGFSGTAVGGEVHSFPLIRKPYRPDELAATIATLLRGSRSAG